MNGIFAYAIFGIYALTISPIITNFIDFLKPNKFVGILGFVMLFAEFFALNFKLKMIRFRTEEKRIAYRTETGKNILPSSPSSVLYGFFLRLFFHVIIVMVSMTALGFPCDEHQMSFPGEFAILSVIVLDFIGIYFLYTSGDFYTDPYITRKDFREEVKADDDWYAANKTKMTSLKYFRLEIASDIVLQLYALMLFTSVWRRINQLGYDILHDAMRNDVGAFAKAILKILKK